MRILLFIGALVAAWFALGRWVMVAEAATGGPKVVEIVDCKLPQPSEDAAMLFASYYEGAAVSPVRLGEGEQGDTTSVVQVKVQPGMGPLYVVIAGSRHSILTFSGWTRRIEQLVVATDPKYPTAVTGLPAERILFVNRRTCGGTTPLDDLYKVAEGRQDLSSASMVIRRPFPKSMSNDERMKQKTLFRMPDAIGGGYEPEQLSLSEFGISAKQYRAHRHGAVPDWFKRARAAYFDPGGIGEVDLGQLVTPVPAAPYSVLPSRAGIAQLIRDGKVEEISEGNYRILAPIAVPEGLYGAHSVTFTLAPGVPSPSGDLGHSKLR